VLQALQRGAQGGPQARGAAAPARVQAAVPGEKRA
jgi:hypothetical protein